MRSNEHFGKHLLASLQNVQTYFNETRYIYSLPDRHDTGDIFKVSGSKIKVADDIFQKCTFLVGACRLTIEDRPVKNVLIIIMLS